MIYRLSVDEAWRRMRALRHNPPKHAATDERKLVFSAASKQAEQFFRHSDNSGYEIKPILLYYGLNQAARAISAAVNDDPEAWELQGHGISTKNIDGDPPLGQLVVVNQRRSGAFEALADILRSPSLPHPVPLQDVWLSLPEGVTVPLQGTEEAWSAAKLKRADSRGFMAELATFPWDKNKVVATLSHLPYELAPLSVDEARRLLFQHYPDLKDFVPVWDEAGGTLKFGWHTDFRLSLDMAYWPRNYDGCGSSGVTVPVGRRRSGRWLMGRAWPGLGVAGALVP